VNFILSTEGQALAASYQFVQLPPVLLTYNFATLASIRTPTGMPTFTSEDSTMPQIGAGQYVISSKRRSFDEVVSTENAQAVARIQSQAPTYVHSDSLHTNADFELCIRGRCYDLDELRTVAIAAVVLASVGLFLAFVAAIGVCILCVNRRSTKPRSVEIKARNIELPSSTSTSHGDNGNGDKV